MQQHHVTYLFPGSFFSEESSRKVSAWDVAEALKDIPKLSDTYPPAFCFYFSTMRREDDEMNGKQVAKSGRYYLGGKVYEYDELPQGKENEILRLNIQHYDGKRAIKTSAGNWQPFLPGDTLLDEVLA